MTIKEFTEILDKIGFNYSEGIALDKDERNNRLIYWDYAWEDISASGESYNTLVTYQVSTFSDDSPKNNKKLKELKNQLALKDIRPNIYHEYVEDSREWHSYFSIEILENV